jgi:hypothetical protein
MIKFTAQTEYTMVGEPSNEHDDAELSVPEMSDPDPPISIGVIDQDFFFEADSKHKAYQEGNAKKWSFPTYSIFRMPHLSISQMAKIIVATGIPLAGRKRLYKADELSDWLSMVPFLEENQDCFVEEYRFCLLSEFSKLSASLTGFADKKVSVLKNTPDRQGLSRGNSERRS